MVKKLITLGCSIAIVILSLIGCDLIFTTPPEQGEGFDQPIPGLTREQQLAFARGDEAFEKRFEFGEGLGPIFNQSACESCHPSDGKSHPTTNLIRFGRNMGSTFDPLLEFGGPQLQNHSLPGIPPEVLPSHANAISVRSGPAAFGLGLIEMIHDSVILALADENDINGDGISGKPNFITAPEWAVNTPALYGGRYLGRFGRKAGAASLLQQVATAYIQDLGITSEFFPSENPHPQAGILGDDVADPEVSTSTIHDVISYLRTLAPPKRGHVTTQVTLGEQLFTQIGCASCHTPKMKTGTHPTIASLSNLEVALYSDMLLHDMGDVLADNFVEGEASGKEWRTTPLWGLRLYEVQLGGTAYYLHDGRTSDLGEAVSLHGGEAEAARNRFIGLSPADREALLLFLKSL